MDFPNVDVSESVDQSGFSALTPPVQIPQINADQRRLERHNAWVGTKNRVRSRVQCSSSNSIRGHNWIVLWIVAHDGSLDRVALTHSEIGVEAPLRGASTHDLEGYFESPAAPGFQNNLFFCSGTKKWGLAPLMETLTFSVVSGVAIAIPLTRPLHSQDRSPSVRVRSQF